jgi:hypothetical protein
VKTINTIDQDLRTRRNLFVHAGWYSPKGKLTRQKKTVKFLKPQSFQPLTLSTNSRVEVKIQEVRALRNAVLRAVKAIVYQAAFGSSSKKSKKAAAMPSPSQSTFAVACNTTDWHGAASFGWTTKRASHRHPCKMKQRP